jgi:hypothetical protein
MTGPTSISRPHTARRAETIYLEARGAIDTRLWRAALGSDATTGATAIRQDKAGLALESLLAAAAAVPAPAQQPVLAPSAENRAPHADAPIGYRQYQSNIKAAAARTNIPSAALAAIVDAEAGKDKAGRWRTDSRNARSTATGLGQFLAGTWRSEAERVGTWLNDAARARGWLGGNGKVLPEAQALLLDLRRDADASINATADYARRSLDNLSKAGIAVGDSVEKIAEAAYIGHNLGPRDAVRFFTGGLDDRRARVLLDAQVGSSRASGRIVEAGSAVAAHRTWLMQFVSKQVRSDRFVD